MAGEITFEIEKELGVIGETPRNWTVELNLVSWNGNPAKYDIRSWSPDKSRMGKGIGLTEDEMNKLVELWQTRNDEDSFE